MAVGLNSFAATGNVQYSPVRYSVLDIGGERHRTPENLFLKKVMERILLVKR